jgi:hypothetical protein
MSNNLATKKGEKVQHFSECNFCNFVCSTKYGWERHIMTPKHMKATNSNSLATKKGELSEVKTYNCEICDKKYQDRTGLWRHKKKCFTIAETHSNFNNINEDLVLTLIHQNKELLEIVKNGTHNTVNNNSHNNNNNKSFNLQFFLNETCKNAMNLMDFVDSIKLQLTDLENVGEVGYVKGISNIIVKNLKALDVTVRPIHCTDSKREVIYVKDDNKWEKETEEKNILRKLIKKVSNKNISLIPEFKAKYPDCIYSESKKSDKYNKIILEAFELADGEKQDKIIRNIAKEVKIDKEDENQ